MCVFWSRSQMPYFKAIAWNGINKVKSDVTLASKVEVPHNDVVHYRSVVMISQIGTIWGPKLG